MQVKVYLGVPYNDSSWKIVADNLELAMRRNPAIDVIRGNGEYLPPDIDDRIELWWGQPHHWNFKKRTQPRIGMTLSEGEVLPSDRRNSYIEKCNSCDLLIVGSKAAAVPFKTSPISVPILVVPLGVDTGAFAYDERRFFEHDFTFLHYGVMQIRKGSSLVLSAFKQVQATNPEAKLIMHHWTSWDEPYQRLLDRYSGLKGVEWHYFPKGAGDVKDVIRLLSRSHCLVAPSLAEGWGMCITEAMSTGIPVITSRYSAMLDYFSEKFGWWVEMSDEYTPLSELFPNTPGFLRLPNLTSLVESMTSAISDRLQCSIRGRAGSEYINKNLSWDMMVKKLVPILIALWSGNTDVLERLRTHPAEFYYSYSV